MQQQQQGQQLCNLMSVRFNDKTTPSLLTKSLSPFFHFLAAFDVRCVRVPNSPFCSVSPRSLCVRERIRMDFEATKTIE